MVRFAVIPSLLAALLLFLALAGPALAQGGSPAAKAVPAGKYEVVLKDGKRIACQAPPVIAFGKVVYTTPDGVKHAMSETVVDVEATRKASAPVAPAAPAQPAALGVPVPVTPKAAPARPGGVGAPALDFEAVAPDGSKVTLASLKGKVVLVDFWATWCGPCVKEMPAVKAVHAKFKDQDFEILGVSLDHDRAKLDAYLKAQGIEWPQYFDGKGWGNAVSRRYGVNSIPHALLVDRDGKIVKTRLRGPELELAVAELLSQPTTSGG